MMTWCQLCWLGAILWSKMNQCGAAVASYVLVRGNALAQAKRGLWTTLATNGLLLMLCARS